MGSYIKTVRRLVIKNVICILLNIWNWESPLPTNIGIPRIMMNPWYCIFCLVGYLGRALLDSLTNAILGIKIEGAKGFVSPSLKDIFQIEHLPFWLLLRYFIFKILTLGSYDLTNTPCIFMLNQVILTSIEYFGSKVLIIYKSVEQ